MKSLETDEGLSGVSQRTVDPILLPPCSSDDGETLARQAEGGSPKLVIPNAAGYFEWANHLAPDSCKIKDASEKEPPTKHQPANKIPNWARKQQRSKMSEFLCLKVSSLLLLGRVCVQGLLKRKVEKRSFKENAIKKTP